jgi:hypothetical protein
MSPPLTPSVYSVGEWTDQQRNVIVLVLGNLEYDLQVVSENTDIWRRREPPQLSAKMIASWSSQSIA